MTELIYGEDQKCGIQKKILFASKQPLPEFQKDTKPMELIIGKKFKLEVWETCLKSMRPTEVASFTVEPSLVSNYPVVAKSLREIRCGKCQPTRHCCGMTLREFGLGHEDLDKLMKEPQAVEFTLELLRVEEVGNYRKDLWALGEEEKIDMIPLLKQEGGQLFQEARFAEAADKYGQAIGLLAQLALKEKPGEEEHRALEVQKVPFLLNFCQCKLLLCDYYPVIKHATEVLELQTDNVKALFRRGRAHIGAWNPQEARKDLARVKELDPSLSKAVDKELRSLAELERQKGVQDQALLRGKMF